MLDLFYFLMTRNKGGFIVYLSQKLLNCYLFSWQWISHKTPLKHNCKSVTFSFVNALE